MPFDNSSFKGRGANTFGEFCQSPILWEPFKDTPTILYDCWQLGTLLPKTVHDVHVYVAYLLPHTFVANAAIRETWGGVASVNCWKWIKWGLKEDKVSGPSMVGLWGFSWRYKRLLSCLGCSSGPVQNISFPHRALFQLIWPNLAPRLWNLRHEGHTTGISQAALLLSH